MDEKLGHAERVARSPHLSRIGRALPRPVPYGFQILGARPDLRLGDAVRRGERRRGAVFLPVDPEIKLTFEIRKLLPAGHPFWGALAEMDAGTGTGRESLGPPAPAERRTRRRRLHNALKTAQVLRPAQRRALSRLIQARQALLRKKRVMEKAMKVLYYWHLFHMPFVIILFLILLIHVYITVMMGHRWIF
jgi:hypothetical protein